MQYVRMTSLEDLEDELNGWMWLVKQDHLNMPDQLTQSELNLLTLTEAEPVTDDRSTISVSVAAARESLK